MRRHQTPSSENGHTCSSSLTDGAWMVVVVRESPRERRGSLMVLDSRSVGRVVVQPVMLSVPVVVGRVVVVVVRVRIVVVVVLGLGGLPLRVLFVLHPPVLEPYLHLALGQVQVSR